MVNIAFYIRPHLTYHILVFLLFFLQIQECFQFRVCHPMRPTAPIVKAGFGIEVLIKGEPFDEAFVTIQVMAG